MMDATVQRTGPLTGELTVPGDKSISHRAVICAALADGPTQIERWLFADDCQRTVQALQSWGAAIACDQSSGTVRVEGGLFGSFRSTESPIDLGNSGTSMRLLAGVAAGQPVTTVLTGDASLCRRPMRRIAEPLRQMGARIDGQPHPEHPDDQELFPPLTIHGGSLHSTSYAMPVASAQVKSSLLLAALSTIGDTSIREPVPTRDHTERLLGRCGAELARHQAIVTLSGRGRPLVSPGLLRIPGDLSSAAFWLVAASLIPQSRVTLRDMGVNLTRTGSLDILRYMGARVHVDRRDDPWEPRGDCTVEAATLRSTVMKAAMVPRTIDELPILMVAATQANGVTEFHGLAELRVKETDRIQSMAKGLQLLGAKIGVHRSQELPAGAVRQGELLGDVVVIEGPTPLHGAVLDSQGDHRTAMSLIVAGLVADGHTTVRGVECIDTSYPGFFDDLRLLGGFVTLAG